MFHENYLNLNICGFTNISTFWKVYADPAKVVEGYSKRAARLNIHDTFNRHACMNLVKFPLRIIRIRPAALVKTNTSVHDIAFSTT